MKSKKTENINLKYRPIIFIDLATGNGTSNQCTDMKFNEVHASGNAMVTLTFGGDVNIRFFAYDLMNLQDQLTERIHYVNPETECDVCSDHIKVNEQMENPQKNNGLTAYFRNLNVMCAREYLYSQARAKVCGISDKNIEDAINQHGVTETMNAIIAVVNATLDTEYLKKNPGESYADVFWKTLDANPVKEIGS